MSGQYFGIYTVEMTLISQIIKDDSLYQYITGELPTNNKTTKTSSTGYVDDMNHLCSNKDIDQLEKATEDMNKLLNEIYRENRLKVNHDKTQILQVESNTSDALKNNRYKITITDKEGNKTTAKSTMKILGITMNSHAAMDSHLSRMKMKMGIELAKIKPYLSSMNRQCQRIIVNSKLKSILDYGAPLFLGESEVSLSQPK